MIIQCDNCHTRFRLDPDRLKGESTRVRCSKCRHVFTVSRPATPEDQETAHPPLESTPRIPPRRASASRYLLLLLPLLLVVAGVALWLYFPRSTQQPTTSTTKGIEFLHLVEARGYFIDNLQAGQLFVIEGRVRNDFPEPRRRIRMRAKLYTSDGQQAQQVDFYAGNSLTAAQLRNLPLEDQRRLIQQPPAGNSQDEVVAPGSEIIFTVSFGNLPELSKLSDYSVEIVASQPA
ncbi:MAG: zinc-ribbon domain-containing protein [Deltaproteobacteria bacterium]|nr:zinc-ribbon domain-containing protein [Deltaproteobacteria bacterium]MBW2071071.1 zinc-ribbon domain-containing protein [Deltaproteobacteria bacterium]